MKHCCQSVSRTWQLDNDDVTRHNKGDKIESNTMWYFIFPQDYNYQATLRLRAQALSFHINHHQRMPTDAVLTISHISASTWILSILAQEEQATMESLTVQDCSAGSEISWIRCGQQLHASDRSWYENVLQQIYLRLHTLWPAEDSSRRFDHCSTVTWTSLILTTDTRRQWTIPALYSFLMIKVRLKIQPTYQNAQVHTKRPMQKYALPSRSKPRLGCAISSPSRRDTISELWLTRRYIQRSRIHAYSCSRNLA